MSDDSKYRKPNGDLTPYAFSCGYIQESEDKNAQLCKDGCWHVKAFDKVTKVWETFARLSKARRFFKWISNKKNQSLDIEVIRGKAEKIRNTK